MAYLRLVLILIVSTFVGAVLGAASGRSLVTLVGGGAIGMLAGLVIGGAIRGRLLDVLFPPGDSNK